VEGIGKWLNQQVRPWLRLNVIVLDKIIVLFFIKKSQFSLVKGTNLNKYIQNGGNYINFSAFLFIYFFLLNLAPYKKITLTKITMWQENGTGLSSHLKPNPLQYTQYTICLYSTIYTLYFCIHLYTYTLIWKRLTWQKEASSGMTIISRNNQEDCMLINNQEDCMLTVCRLYVDCMLTVCTTRRTVCWLYVVSSCCCCSFVFMTQDIMGELFNFGFGCSAFVVHLSLFSGWKWALLQ
jgi:hypothetical protein